jgi:hypothetical protein
VKTTLSLDDYELSILALAMRGYLDGLDEDYDDDHVAMENLLERVKAARRRLRARGLTFAQPRPHRVRRREQT